MENSKEIDVFCKNIKMLRKRNSLSKKEMAELLGIGITSLSNIEQGIIPPRASTRIIFRASKNFNIQPHKLFMPL